MSKEILERLEEGEEAVTSTLVISQVLSYLKLRRRMHAIPTFLQYLLSIPTLEKIETNFDDFVVAKKIQEANKVPWSFWDDCVIAAQMKRVSVTEIYSNDTDFDSLAGIKRVFA